VVRSAERPPPGTIEWMCGWDWSCRPQGCRTPVNPGRSVPMKRSSVASRFESRGRRLQPRLGREGVDGRRRKGLSVSGTGR